MSLVEMDGIVEWNDGTIPSPVPSFIPVQRDALLRIHCIMYR